MRRLFILFLALCCFMAGCGSQESTKPSSEASDTSEDLGSYFEDQSSDNEVGSIGVGLQAPMDMVYTYTGESLRVLFSISGAAPETTTEVGVLLFVDGVAQPYAAVYEDGTELAENYMQVFNLEDGQQEDFDLVFQPVTGKAGETVPIMTVTILKPSFIAEGKNNPRYGYYHQESATTSRYIAFETDAPGQTLAAATTDYTVIIFNRSSAS